MLRLIPNLLYFIFKLSSIELQTFLLGECMTGAGGDGGPLGIFLFVLKTKKLKKKTTNKPKIQNFNS